MAANGDYAEVAPALGNTEYFQSPSTVYYASNANSSVTSYSIYNVHATPSNAGTPSSPAVLISWAGGLPTIGPISSVWPSATAPATGPGGAFNSSATGTVYLSTTSNLVNGATPGPSAYTAGSFTAVAVQYLRNYTSTSANTDNSGTYNWGVPANFCYLSGNQFHALATGLTPNTRYYYVVGNASGYSKEFSFTTPPAPAAASTYPFSLGLIADVGQTVNTSLGLTALAAMKPKLVLNVGDLTYADTYNECNSTFGFSQWCATRRRTSARECTRQKAEPPDARLPPRTSRTQEHVVRAGDVLRGRGQHVPGAVGQLPGGAGHAGAVRQCAGHQRGWQPRD